jgi:RimJ/RimL family protein N-acetyltransferase
MNWSTCRFVTSRLHVAEWHTLATCEALHLPDIVASLLTPGVTRALPEAWRGGYDLERAESWVRERDLEGATLLALDRTSSFPVGLVILSVSSLHNAPAIRIRLGYLLGETCWGQGLASELVQGFVDWCRSARVGSIVAGVERNNVASRRVLQKSGFVRQPGDSNAEQQFFELRLSADE